MFRGVISRDGGEPWGSTGMSTARWFDVPVRAVRIGELYATQPGILFHAICGEQQPTVGGDPYPHVIDWGGELYLEDGHHRTVRAAIGGAQEIEARVLHVPA